MASQIDTVRKLHAPSLVKVPDTFDVDVICEHCTDLIRSAVEKLDQELATKTPDIQYPCDTALSAGSTEDAARAEAEKLRGDYFDSREAELREELEYIETVRSLISDDQDEPEAEEPETEEPKAEEKPEPKKPARKAPAKKAPAKKAEPKAEEPEPEEEKSVEPEVSPEVEQEDPEDNDWDF